MCLTLVFIHFIESKSSLHLIKFFLLILILVSQFFYNDNNTHELIQFTTQTYCQYYSNDYVNLITAARITLLLQFLGRVEMNSDTISTLH